MDSCYLIILRSLVAQAGADLVVLRPYLFAVFVDRNPDIDKYVLELGGIALENIEKTFFQGSFFQANSRGKRPHKRDFATIRGIDLHPDKNYRPLQFVKVETVFFKCYVTGVYATPKHPDPAGVIALIVSQFKPKVAIIAKLLGV